MESTLKVSLLDDPLTTENVQLKENSFDIAIVFPVDVHAEKKSFTKAGLFIVQKMSYLLGKENMKIYISIEKSEIFVLLRPVLGKIQAYAQKSKSELDHVSIPS